MTLGTAVLLAGALAVALVLVVPRPDIVLSNAAYYPSTCDEVNRTRVVIATFLLTNQGGISGAVQVDLLADQSTLTWGMQFNVPAKASIRGTLTGVVQDCAPHTYGLHMFYDASGG